MQGTQAFLFKRIPAYLRSKSIIVDFYNGRIKRRFKEFPE